MSDQVPPVQPTPTPPASSGQPPTVVVQSAPAPRRFSWFGLITLLLLAFVLLRQFFAGDVDPTFGIQEKFVSGNARSRDKIAVLRVEGLIMEGDGFVKRQIDRIRNDRHVKAIVLRVNSPGGTVTGSDYIYHHLKKLREETELPLVVSMGAMAASGGYYVSMAVGDQEKSIYAEPTTTTGSIGVIVPHYDLSGLLARMDVEDDSIASGPRKQMLSMTRPLSDDHRRIMEAYVDEAFTRFKQIVQAGRPALRSEEPNLLANGVDVATGEIFTARQALQHGLIDEIGFLEDAIARAGELGGVDPAEARVVRYERHAALLDGLVGFAQGRGRADQLSALLELSTPRAYYLATALPPLLPMEPR